MDKGIRDGYHLKSVELNAMSRRTHSSWFWLPGYVYCHWHSSCVLPAFSVACRDYVYHPDEPKQVVALDQYLRDSMSGTRATSVTTAIRTG